MEDSERKQIISLLVCATCMLLVIVGTPLTWLYAGQGDVSISGNVAWDVSDEKSLPSEITVLLKDGDLLMGEVTVTKGNGWEYTFDKVPKYDANQREIGYEVKAAEVEGFEIEAEGTNLISTDALSGAGKPSATGGSKEEEKPIPTPSEKDKDKKKPVTTPSEENKDKEKPVPTPSEEDKDKEKPAPTPSEEDKDREKLTPTPSEEGKDKATPTPSEENKDEEKLTPTPSEESSDNKKPGSSDDNKDGDKSGSSDGSVTEGKGDKEEKISTPKMDDSLDEGFWTNVLIVSAVGLFLTCLFIQRENGMKGMMLYQYEKKRRREKGNNT